MSKLSLDEAMLSKLRDVKKRVEICDDQGRIVGYFEPSKYAGMVIPPDPTEEELRIWSSITSRLHVVWGTAR